MEMFVENDLLELPVVEGITNRGHRGLVSRAGHRPRLSSPACTAKAPRSQFYSSAHDRNRSIGSALAFDPRLWFYPHAGAADRGRIAARAFARTLPAFLKWITSRPEPLTPAARRLWSPAQGGIPAPANPS